MPGKRGQGQVGLTIYLPAELRDAANETTAARGEDVSSVVRAALRRYVKRHRQQEPMEGRER
jgi:metal-responsive CopG/Arc/MetJ family transcriptional regulator